MGKDGDACTGLYFQIINAASVIHKPEFNFILYLLKTKDTSGLSIQCLVMYSQYLIRLFRAGTTLTLAGFDEERTLPKSTIKLNGTHSIKFGNNLYSGDGKATLAAGGAKGNLTYTPEWKHHQEEMVDPNFPANSETYISLAHQKIFFQLVDSF